MVERVGYPGTGVSARRMSKRSERAAVEGNATVAVWEGVDIVL